MTEGPIIHIGYPKAGSSFLQELIFPEVEHYSYISDRHLTAHLGKTYWFDSQDEHQRIFGNKTDYIVSREQLSSPTYSMLQSRNYRFPTMALSNLIQFYKDRGVFIVVLRRQDSLIESFLRFKSSYFASERSLFLDFFMGRPGLNRLAFNNGMLLESFDFLSNLLPLISVVGQRRVKILLFEDLVERPEVFLDGLGSVFDQDLGHLLGETKKRINASKPTAKPGGPILAALDRRLNGCISRVLPERKVALSASLRRRLMELYGPGNEKLFALAGLENRYGYF